MNSLVGQMKNSQEGLTSREGAAEEIISELENELHIPPDNSKRWKTG